MAEMTKFYIDGVEVKAPELTENEIKVLEQLSQQPFGDGTNWGLLSLYPDGDIPNAGYELVKCIKWDDRKALGGVLTSLQEKKIITVDEGEYIGKTRMEIWFDCDAVDALLGK